MGRCYAECALEEGGTPMLAAGPFGLGPLELGVIVIVLLLVFGASRLADLGGSLGKGIREFRRNVKDEADADTQDTPSLTTSPASNEAAAAAPSGRFCSNCGTALSADTKFCSKCGAPTPAAVN
jgi:sec-independent protein translocase protein TatA